MLSGKEIRQAIEDGVIIFRKNVDGELVDCEGVDLNSVGPNSLDVRLSDELKVHVDNVGNVLSFRDCGKVVLGQVSPGIANDNLRSGFKEDGCLFDPGKKVKPAEAAVKIPPSGLLLIPGVCYLGLTVEVVGSNDLVPVMHGRSSLGRTFFEPHCVAGFGDLGFVNQWTLEIMARLPIVVYPGMRVAQLAFYRVGDLRGNDSYADRPTSKYAKTVGATSSLLHRDGEFSE